MIHNFIYDPYEEVLRDFIGRYRVVVKDDARCTKVLKIVAETVRHLKGANDQRFWTRANQVLESRWYKSLDTGRPDYSVYQDDSYVAELMACFFVYSRETFKKLIAPKKIEGGGCALSLLGSPRSILDLGCGTGYTTGCIRQLYPNAAIYGHDLANTVQYEIASGLGSRYGFTMADGLGNLPEIDVIFALEFFEHIYEPIVYLEYCISHLKPKIFVIANSFGSMAIGHFKKYEHHSQIYSQTKIVRLFNETLRRNGYVMEKTALWNSRPAIWRRARCE